MSNCPKCGAIFTPDSKFCEKCGYQLGTTPKVSAQAQDQVGVQPQAPASPGALKPRIGILAGTTKRMKARLQSITRKLNQENEAEQPAKADASSAPQQKQCCCQGSKVKTFVSILSGLALAALFVWFLLRKTASKAATLLFKL